MEVVTLHDAVDTLHDAADERIAGAQRRLQLAQRGLKIWWGTVKAGHLTGRGRERARTTSRRVTNGEGISPVTPVAFGAGLGAGALMCFFLDPKQGRRRRHEARDRVLSIGRRGARRAERRAARTARGARGRFMRVVHRHNGHPGELDDASLADKVRSEALRDHEVPAGHVNVNAEHGTVVLRGQVASQEQIDHLIEKAEHVEGVRSVKSLLHTP